MAQLPGVYQATKKDGTIYYRSSITFCRKHISLGSFPSQKEANIAYQEACDLLADCDTPLEVILSQEGLLSFEKKVVLMNFRDNGIYIKNPIYLMKRYFNYYVTPTNVMKFDIDDLFYYSNHKIMKRGGHLFVSDFGMQVNLLSRYGIRNFAVIDQDYYFVNKDTSDFRYGNIQVVNRYHGVFQSTHKNKPIYTAKIHVNGYLIIGRYETEQLAAIAYNKAAALLKQKGVLKAFPTNDLYEMNEIEYAKYYHQIKLSKRVREFTLP